MGRATSSPDGGDRPPEKISRCSIASPHKYSARWLNCWRFRYPRSRGRHDGPPSTPSRRAGYRDPMSGVRDVVVDPLAQAGHEVPRSIARATEAPRLRRPRRARFVAAGGTRRVIAHHLCLEFRADGQVDFYPTTTDPAELAARLARVVRMFLECPTAIRCAAGHHESQP